MRGRIRLVLAGLAVFAARARRFAARARRREPGALRAAAGLLAAAGLGVGLCATGVVLLTSSSSTAQGGSGLAAGAGHCTVSLRACEAGTPPAAPTERPRTALARARPSPRPRPTTKPAPRHRPRRRPAVRVTFAPYVDTSLSPSFSLTTAAKQTGVKDFNLAFVESGGGCTPRWGGGTSLGSNPVTDQIGSLRKIGGDVRVSFGGQAGTDLAHACADASQLADAYQKVISAYRIDKVDFDVESAALGDTTASLRRARAIAKLQAQDPHLQVSFTLPAEPYGLTQAGLALLASARSNGVRISAVNVMAMDYGDSAAPHPAGRMGMYAIDVARSAQAQVERVLGVSSAAAWSKIAITPMIGVNDMPDEIFTVADAAKVAKFAASAHLAWLSMWSGTRDKECDSGAKSSAVPTCSSIVQAPWAFATALRP